MTIHYWQFNLAISNQPFARHVHFYTATCSLGETSTTHSHTHTHTYYIHTNAHKHTHILHTHKCTQTHTHTHTHTHTSAYMYTPFRKQQTCVQTFERLTHIHTPACQWFCTTQQSNTAAVYFLLDHRWCVMEGDGKREGKGMGRIYERKGKRGGR